MRRVATAALALAWATAATAAAANDAEPDSRGLQLGITYTNNQGSTQSAMVGVSEGCYKIGGATEKLSNVVCLDKTTAAALKAAQPAKAYAKVTGAFTNTPTGNKLAKTLTCTFYVEGLTDDFAALSKYPPQVFAVMGAGVAANEKVGFSFLLPIDENAGTTQVTGSTGPMTMCNLVPAPAVTATTTTTTTTTTGGAGAGAAVDEEQADSPAQAAPVATTDPVDAAAPAAGAEAPGVKETGTTSPAPALAASAWTLALGAAAALALAA